MKKYLAGFLISISFLGVFSWVAAQGTKTDLFDVVKAQQELEIMKGILATTLSFVTQNLQKQPAAIARAGQAGTSGTWGVWPSWRYSNVSAFYLYGQGAVFVVPTSGMRLMNYRLDRNLLGDEAMLYSQVAQLSARSVEMALEAARTGLGAGAGSGKGTGTGAAAAVAPQTPKPPTAPLPPKPPTPPQVNQEELRKKLAEAQETVRKSRQEDEASREKFLAALGQVKTYLIEALANHGDSLTTVKPNEYITVVIMTDDIDGTILNGSTQSTRQQIISAQKAWITDYKAGRLTLDAFKQKVLQYNE